MTDSQEINKALDRNEFLVTELLKYIGKLPNILGMKSDIQEKLENLRSAIQGMRPPRVMVIGRCKSGKSSLINAICGLKVAEVSDIKPETGMAEWKKYYHNGSDLIRILDTRGLQELEAPRQFDSAKNPYESIIEAVKKECPDIILFLCKATEVYSASQEDLNKCELIIREINKIHHQNNLPIIGVLTKCDELAPPKEPLPTDNERKKRNLQEQVTNFSVFLNQRSGLSPYVKEVVPTVAYAEYEDGKNGLILPDQDYRWNITELVETMIKHTPKERHASLSRMAHLKGFQLKNARTVVTACTAVSGFVSANPIPGAAIPIVAVIQTFMVMYVGWLSGREFSQQTVQDFLVTGGVGAGANLGMIGLADIALKVIPGWGSLLAASAGAIATQGLGDTAIAYFLNNGKTP
ncbi:GTPase family protein [Sphaerospermopsis torques-reginae]|uniref:50S ribosome-binding GTPase n=1 Tax=Sphaerospermopsis torques-reginae ITEP-024 TaxID=984208 RepID=A0ABX8X0M5_9CYAN|nr:GTPase [Sphaerospermopsis torques-reginae]QYX32219.1 50S ribosome-binding GTPase [Sphaerospermopsis torques-reginae ITEP-024]